jgi:V/A-type H+-transporting ATPase subunit I
MIVKMKKYTFVIYHREYQQFLEDIQDIGIIHIVEKKDLSAESVRMRINLIKRIDLAVKHLKTKLTGGHYSKEVNREGDAEKLVSEVEKMLLEIDQNHQKLHQLNKELNNQLPWGDFSVETVRKLQSEGIETRLFVINPKSFDEEWAKKYAVEKISYLGGNLNFAVFTRTGEEVDIGTDEVRMFDRSVKEIRTEIDAFKAKIATDNEYLAKFAYDNISTLEYLRKKTENEKQYMQVYDEASSAADYKLMILEGWIPVSTENKAKEYFESKRIVYLEREPVEEEIPQVPILMQNGYFARMFEPIARLFSLPAYNELDLTVFFAPFFMLFFGFCLGDAGYGIVLITVGTVLKFKLKKEFKPMLSLIQLLGLMTVLMGVVGGTFFGINLIEVDWKFRDMFLDSNSLFWLALGLGVVQILFGMCIKAANLIRKNGSFIYAVSTFGWMIMVLSLVGMSVKAILGYLKMDPDAIARLTYLDTVSGIAGKTALVGVAMILLFNDPKANLLTRILKGLWQLYDITGLFGDVLSYIRLFALGVSGAILGLVINSIAAEFLNIPYIGWLIWIVFLIIGHTGNILLSGLGSLVHPMRLTFVEFYKNAGWTGGGKEYKPFKKSV